MYTPVSYTHLTANLDEAAIGRLREQIGLLKQQGHTVVIAEHRLYFLKDLIDRAVYIKAVSYTHLRTVRGYVR